MHIHAYLTFNGNCEAAFKFYAQALGGQITMMQDHAGIPNTPREWVEKIMHAELRVGGAMLLGSDRTPEHFQGHKGFNVSVTVEAPQEAERVFEALSQGATVTQPLGTTFWAQRFGMLVDSYGVAWIVNCPANK